MSRRATFAVLLLAILIGGVCAAALYRYSASMAATSYLTVPVKEIKPYTIVTSDMVQLAPFPEPMAQADVYRSIDEVIGKIATTTLMPRQLLYAHQLVAPQQFRYADDPQLEIVSFPVKPEQAAGAELRAGQRINLYRPLVSAEAIGLELLVADVRHAADGYLIVTVGAPTGVVRQIMDQSSAAGRDSLWVTLAPVQAIAEAQP